MCLDVVARCFFYCLRFVRGGWQKVRV
jgi:hypothetical protein